LKKALGTTTVAVAQPLKIKIEKSKGGFCSPLLFL
jgi:hypothetical protein